MTEKAIDQPITKNQEYHLLLIQHQIDTQLHY